MQPTELKSSHPLPKPFDLQEALSGKLVLLRKGTTARVAAYNSQATEFNQVIGWDHDQHVLSWSLSGRFNKSDESHHDIIGMAPVIHQSITWVNIYPNGSSYGYPTKEHAELCAGDDMVMCVPISYEVVIE